MAGGGRWWKCNCDWISSTSRSIEVAVRKLTGAPGSRLLGQPFHRSSPTIENSVCFGYAPSSSSLLKPGLSPLHPIFGRGRMPPRARRLPLSFSAFTRYTNYLYESRPIAANPPSTGSQGRRYFRNRPPRLRISPAICVSLARDERFVEGYPPNTRDTLCLFNFKRDPRLSNFPTHFFFGGTVSFSYRVSRISLSQNLSFGMFRGLSFREERDLSCSAPEQFALLQMIDFFNIFVKQISS